MTEARSNDYTDKSWAERIIFVGLNADETMLLSAAALYGLHCAGISMPGVLSQVHKYIERMRLTLNKDAGAQRILESLSKKMEAATAQAIAIKPEVFTI